MEMEKNELGSFVGIYQSQGIVMLLIFVRLTVVLVKQN
jgi:hypothetical protein